MKHLAYVHQRNVALVETLGNAVRGCLARRLRLPQERPAGRQLGRRLLGVLVWILALAIQAGLVVLAAQLIELVHGVIDLYLELADLQLTLQSQYVAATSVP